MKDPFLEKFKISDTEDAKHKSLRAALQRNKTYVNGTSTNDRKVFRDAWAALIVETATKYKQEVTDPVHCHNVAQITESLSNRFAPILMGDRLRFGTSQKAFNLYLKCLWRLKELGRQPPHCPIDRIVLQKAKSPGSWTKSDSVQEYESWIDAIRKCALTERKTLADWEYDVWNNA